MRITLISMTFV